ncbi:unnamed protein product [Adineta steineri]|uniref:Uncharacterized protein n=1 Tax=Adineta steineri TaxID=433720 RepID=A0A813VDC8_9BILA|nr:unnamed protein product [Adineta steineri]CAF1070826.1 unnamed protein product [Adineta steineri]CAF1271603.1 unnamed protein product [Adineta steineri]
MIVTHAFTTDLKPFSEYSDEEEELLSPISPGVCFTVHYMKNKQNKQIIHLALLQQQCRFEKQRTSDDVDHFGNSLYNDLHNNTDRIGFTRDWKN